MIGMSCQETRAKCLLSLLKGWKPRELRRKLSWTAAKVLVMLTESWFWKCLTLVPLLLESFSASACRFLVHRSEGWIVTEWIVCSHFTFHIVIAALSKSRVTFSIGPLNEPNRTFAFSINSWNDVLAIWIFVPHFALVVIQAITTNFRGCKMLWSYFPAHRERVSTYVANIYPFGKTWSLPYTDTIHSSSDCLALWEYTECRWNIRIQEGKREDMLYHSTGHDMVDNHKFCSPIHNESEEWTVNIEGTNDTRIQSSCPKVLDHVFAKISPPMKV